MRRTLTLLLALAPTSALAADALHEALVDNLATQQQQLSLGDDAPPIYHLRYHLMRLQQVDLVASLGHVVQEDSSPYNLLAVELRVGKPEFDNTGFGGWENGFATAWLPATLTPHAVDLAAWRLTDTAYKQAVEQYARKQAQFTAPPDYPGDYTLTAPVTATATATPVSDLAPLRQVAETLSGVFEGRPGLERGEVYIGHEAGTHSVIDTGGVDVQRAVAETSVRAVAHVRAADGMLLTDSILWSVRQADALPPLDVMKAQVQAMTDDLLALADAPTLDDEVVGPVVFTDGAAIDLFRSLLLTQLEGTPPEVPFDTWLGDLGAGGGAVRLGRRVLPEGWSVSDDPTRDPRHPAAYTHDYEGTPAQAVDFVQDGIVREVAMSRVPRKDRGTTNGHARGSLQARLSGRTTLTEVKAAGARSQRALHKRALKLARAYGRDWYLRVERLQEPAVASLGGSFSMFGGDEESLLAAPVAVVKVSADGSEQRLRGTRFSGVQRFVLRDLVAAGPSVEGTFFIPPDPGDGLWSPTGGLPAWLRVPQVVVGELEVVPAPGDRNDAPLLPHPATLAGRTAAP